MVEEKAVLSVFLLLKVSWNTEGLVVSPHNAAVAEAVHTPDATKIEQKPDEQNQPEVYHKQHMDAWARANLSTISGERVSNIKAVRDE